MEFVEVFNKDVFPILPAPWVINHRKAGLQGKSGALEGEEQGLIPSFLIPG
jgi:hypothetical protein